MIELIKLSLVIIVTVGVVLAEIVIATGLILKQFHYLKTNINPIKAITPTMPQKKLTDQEKKLILEQAQKKLMEFG